MAEQRLTEIKKIRLEKVKKLREQGIEPYPSKLLFQKEKINVVRDSLSKKGAVAGRVMSFREHGNIIFLDITDDSGTIQLFFQKKLLLDKYSLVKSLDIGDFLLARGEVFKTGAGEITINVEQFQLLSKSIRPLPSSWHGLSDTEERFRKRYLDLLFNSEVRARFEIRTKLVREIRNYLDNLSYQEVETPTLQTLYGGANAKPFKTHLNALSTEMYLRIADELYLKRLIVGGYERVYEICKDFRNEGMDLTHNPEFTMLEFYETYADYLRIMEVTEGMFKHLAKTVLGKTEMEIGKRKIDIGKKWRRVEMTEIIKEELGLDVLAEQEAGLIRYGKENNVPLLGGETKGQLIFLLFEHLVTDKLIEPTWVIDYPKEVSPLAKDHPKKKGWVERFEGYIGGKEICDGWSELTDPVEQRARFLADVKAVRKDQEEAQKVDEDFLEAMEYGMPPTGGIGIGIDRLTMFFTNTWSIKEVILYPLMKVKQRKIKITK